jgi:Protein of unknown function (DUF1706)
MDRIDPTLALRREYAEFCEVIWALPEELYLAKIDDWAPRDVVAHLVGWNWRMLQACRGILKGQTPDYYADAPDYRTINAGYVARHASTSREALLRDLAAGLEELTAYASGLEPAEWEASHGVKHYRGAPATVSTTLASLAGDYAAHARQIREWQSAR